jgi:hypothetical protein
MSKYADEFAGLDTYTLLGRVREIVSQYRFSESRRGRRANWRARAIEEMAYRAQDEMVAGRDEVLESHVAQWNAPRCELGASVAANDRGVGTPAKSHPTRPGGHVQLSMVFP